MHANEVPPPGALVVAADEELRILFRGLLQLQHVRVDAEAEGVTEALRLIRDHRPRLVVADSQLADGTPAELLGKARAIDPCLRLVLVAPSSRPPPATEKERAPDVLLLRPFRIQQFADAVAPRAPEAREAARSS